MDSSRLDKLLEVVGRVSDPQHVRRALEKRLQANPLRWIKRPDGTVAPLAWLPHQQRAWQMFTDERRRVVGMIGANRLGKTLWAVSALAEVALGIPHSQWGQLDADPGKWKLGPPTKTWCVTVSFEKSRDMQQRAIWQRFPRVMLDKRWNLRTGFPHRILQLPNGSTIQFKSEEQDATTFESEDLDFIWIDETVRQQTFMICLPRLVDRAGRVVITTIPDDPWLDDLFVERSFDPATKEVLSEKEVGYVTGQMQDNTYIPAQMADFLNRTLTAEERIYRVLGHFARKAGLVYADFSPAVHGENLDPPLPVDWAANRYEVIDPGWRNPCAVGFVAVGPRDVVHLYDEWHATERTVGEVACAIYLTRWRWLGLVSPAEAAEFARLAGLAADSTVPASTAAHLARNRELRALLDAWRGTKGDRAPRGVLVDEYGLQKKQDAPVGFIDQLREYGIHCRPAANRGKDNQRTKLREWLRPLGGLVRLRVNACCAWTAWEFTHHRYEKPDKVLGEFKADREIVVDGHNHHLVGLEYLADEAPRYLPIEAGALPGSLWGEHEALMRAEDDKQAWRRRG